MTTPPEQPAPARSKPSRRWYLLAFVMLLGSATVFVLTLQQKAVYLQGQLAPMPRFVGPTADDGVVIQVNAPGKQNIFYENLGKLDGKPFDTPRRQIWPTYESPAMTCTVTHVETGEALEVRLPGMDDPASKSKTSLDQVITYNTGSMQGHSLWVFDAAAAGEYRITLRYVEAVAMDPADIVIPNELTNADKKTMTQADGEAQEAARREAIEQAALAQLEPIEVLFAVGPDPTRGSFFEVIGLKGAATLLAFGFTFSILITLVTFMLRSGHVTPRGQMSDVKRMSETV